MSRVRTGLENIAADPPAFLKGKRIGLLCNPASVDSGFRHARFLISKAFPENLTALFSPQHGFFAEKQDNMVESDHGIDPVLNIPVFSLYGEIRMPTKEMLERIDVLLVDLQDTGCRVYTFVYTMSFCMEAAAREGKTVVILDRPNPIGGVEVEGNLVRQEYTSFVGRYPIPMRHGLTVGELALLFNQQFGIGCNLHVVRMTGWEREMYFEDTGLPWVAPSPNMPTPETAIVYPGQVLWEGTNISEGRGTTQPFLLFGAPFIDPDAVMAAMGYKIFPGAVLRPCGFEPTSNKWMGHFCRGFQIHVTDPFLFRPYETTLTLLQAIIRVHEKHFEWKQPPYEYEYEKLPIDLLIGDRNIREGLIEMDAPEKMKTSFSLEEQAFRENSRKYRLYPFRSRDSQRP